jgi:Carboxypeptidase regulatory-like domain
VNLGERLGAKVLGGILRRGGSGRRKGLIWFGLSVALCGSAAQAKALTIIQSGQSPTAPGASELPDAPRASTAAGGQQADPRLAGSINGTLVDPSGAAVAGARVALKPGDKSPNQEVMSDGDGQFAFANIVPGPFQITITAAGFATQTVTGVLHSGEVFAVPPVALAVATEVTEVRVVLPQVEVAEAEIKEQEKQRVLGVIPNFYVSYIPNAAPLSSKQKFELAWRSTIDPVTFVLTGAIAGVEQANNSFKGYGQGAQGYAKRYGATYADTLTGTFIGSAILPSILKQDPRYFYKGTGSTQSRILYAIANAFICKGDNKRWQPNYSSIAGSLAAGGISNLYYPASDRNGAALTFENTLIGIGATAATNILQEFLIRKLTPNVPNYQPAKP